MNTNINIRSTAISSPELKFVATITCVSVIFFSGTLYCHGYFFRRARGGVFGPKSTYLLWDKFTDWRGIPPLRFCGGKSVGEELCIWGYLPSPLCFSDVYTYAVKNLTLEIKTLETTVFIQCLVMSSSVNVKFHSKFGFIISWQIQLINHFLLLIELI